MAAVFRADRRGENSIRLAIEKYGLPVSGEKVKQGYEQIKGFTLGGLLPPLGSCLAGLGAGLGRLRLPLLRGLPGLLPRSLTGLRFRCSS